MSENNPHMVNNIQLKHCFLLIVILFFTACSTQKTTSREKEIISNHEMLEYYQAQQNDSAKSLEDLNEMFWSLDDPLGVWKTYIMLAEFYRDKDSTKAASYNDQAEMVARQINDSQLLYETYVQRYLLTMEKSWLNKAKPYAKSTYEKNQIYWYAGEYSSIVSPGDSGSPSERAWSYYWLADINSDSQSLSRAINQFKQADNKIGLADSYALKAKFELNSGQTENCKWYVLRAGKLYKNLDMTSSESTLKKWSEDNGCSQQ